VLGEVPVPVLIFLSFAVLAHIVLRYTRYGRHVYAVGGNPEAARLSGREARNRIYGIADQLSAQHGRGAVLGAIGDVLNVPIAYWNVPEAVLPVMAETMGLLRKVGLPVPIDRQRIRMSRLYMYYDNHKAVEALGLRPRSFDETVADTFNWYCANGYLKHRTPPVRLANVQA